MSTSRTQPTVGQFLFLAFLVPLMFLVVLEVLCRVFNTPALFAHDMQQVELEMPAWMMRDEGSQLKAARVAKDPSALEWLSLFEEGEGYRVRLIPNVSRNVPNTFSHIPFRRTQGYEIKSNSLGFRGAELSRQKPESSYRILIFGDSSSFGWGVNEDQMYAAVLQRELQNAIPQMKIEVGNFAIPGDSSEFGKLIFERFAKQFNPDLIILGFGANDAKRSITPHRKLVDAYRSSSVLQSLRHILEKSELFRTLQGALTRTPPKPSAPAVQSSVGKKRFRKNLRDMAVSARDTLSADTLLLTLCTPGDYSRTANTLAEREHLLFLNGQGLLIESIEAIRHKKIHPELVSQMEQEYPQALKRNELNYISDDGCHPNVLGHRIVGEALAQQILDANLIPADAIE